MSALEQRAAENRVLLPGWCGMTLDLFAACFVPLPAGQPSLPSSPQDIGVDTTLRFKKDEVFLCSSENLICV